MGGWWVGGLVGVQVACRGGALQLNRTGCRIPAPAANKGVTPDLSCEPSPCHSLVCESPVCRGHIITLSHPPDRGSHCKGDLPTATSHSLLSFLFTMQGIHIVTPNKKLGSGPLSEYLAVKQLQRAGKAHLMYEVSRQAVLLFGTAAANCCWLTAPAGLVLLLCCKLTTWETWRSVSLPRLHHPFLAPGRAPWVLGCPSSAPSSRCWTPGTRCSASRACSGVGQAPWLSAAPPQCRATQCRVVQCSQRVS